MKKETLQEAPTKEELLRTSDAHNDAHGFYFYSISESFEILVSLNKQSVSLCTKGTGVQECNKLKIEFTKEAINNVLKTFGRAPALFSCQVRVDQVWQDKEFNKLVLVLKITKDGTVMYYFLANQHIKHGQSSLSAFTQLYTKKAETVESYLAERKKEIKTEQVPMSYSYKELKKLDKISFHLNGPDHTSLNALKQLYQLSEFLNSKFKPCKEGRWYNVIYDTESKQLLIESHDVDIKCGLTFFSYAAAAAAMKHNQELFFEYLQIPKKITHE